MKPHRTERHRALAAALVAAVVGVPLCDPTPSLTVYFAVQPAATNFKTQSHVFVILNPVLFTG
jgi:hypothetical protein